LQVKIRITRINNPGNNVLFGDDILLPTDPLLKCQKSRMTWS